MAEARAAYRALQRTISKQLSSDRGNQWQVYVRQCFRRPLENSRISSLQEGVRLAQDCADLISSVKDHKVRTLTSYVVGTL